MIASCSAPRGAPSRALQPVPADLTEQVWLLPVFSVLARARRPRLLQGEVRGPADTGSGPVLLVANHPNSLLDPTLVVASAGRPVRFLAKAPLFSDRKIGWLVRAAGAIPVYRRSDDPSLMSRNEDAFRAVFEVLGGGAVVGIFPEGISHSAAVDGTAEDRRRAHRAGCCSDQVGARFPIVPVGLVVSGQGHVPLRRVCRARCSRSRGTISPRAGRTMWSAVRELTSRIDVALPSGDGQPRLDGKIGRWLNARFASGKRSTGTPSRDAERLARMEFTTGVLARRSRIGRLERTRACVRRPAPRSPADATRPAPVGSGRGRWRWCAACTGQRGDCYLFLPLGIVFAVVGAALFWVPYQLTGIDRRPAPAPAGRAVDVEAADRDCAVCRSGSWRW